MDTIDEFLSNLWNAWYEYTLNWAELGLEVLESEDSLPGLEKAWIDSETREIVDQQWPLSDPNGFYYPLFGLGETNSQIALVGIAPGHNVKEPWTDCIYSGKFRATYAGPFKNPKDWSGGENISSAKNTRYHHEFETQKNDWKITRYEKDTPLVKELENLQCSLSDDLLPFPKEGPLDNFYYTNFMKDGEFKHSNNPITHTDLPDGLVDGWTDSERLYFSNQPSNLISPNRWPNIGKFITTTSSLCELLSREFWLPVLGAELSIQQPDYIIPTGEKPTRAISRLYKLDQSWDHLYEVGHQSFEVEESVIIPTYHWSNGDSNLDRYGDKIYSNLGDELQGRYDEVNSQNRWQILASQIEKFDS